MLVPHSPFPVLHAHVGSIGVERNLLGAEMGVAGVVDAGTYGPLGLTLEEVLERAAISPRRFLGLEHELQVGAPADLSVFSVAEGDFDYDDCSGAIRTHWRRWFLSTPSSPAPSFVPGIGIGSCSCCRTPAAATTAA